MPKRVALYVRVSTDGQTVQNQLGELRQVADRHGWQIIHTYADEGISGTKGILHEQDKEFIAMLPLTSEDPSTPAGDLYSLRFESGDYVRVGHGRLR